MQSRLFRLLDRRIRRMLPRTAPAAGSRSGLLALAVCLYVLAAGTIGAAAERLSFSAALESITADQLRHHVEVLAGDTFEGREAGSRGGHAAGGYLTQLLQQHGLQPAGDARSFYQGFGNQYRNVLAMLEGSDPKLKNQVVLVSAHYDHVGYGNSRTSFGPLGYIHNGADDNASGDAALLELIEAFARLEPAPKRSVLFAFWDGEEKGLLGSKHWASRPTIPLERVAMMVNVDMVGRLRNDRIEVYGARTAHDLRRLVSDQNRETALLIDFDWEMKRNSDHYSFFERNIPDLMIHTGLHPDYHRPSDDVEKINFQGLQRVARLLFGVMRELADAPTLPPFRAASRQEGPANEQLLERPLAPLPGRLGLSWDAQHFEGPGLRVVSVQPGSAADRAGIRRDDRILKLNGHELEPKSDLRALVLPLASAITMEVKRPDAESPVELKVELVGAPVRIGVAWREDEGEPGSVLIVRVVPGSPAEKAGVMPLDRVYQVAGQAFANGDEFHKRMTAAAGRVELLLERDGRERTAALELPPLAE
jgi:membrane-associated protease RseP (regulator of RpoE activity)